MSVYQLKILLCLLFLLPTQLSSAQQDTILPILEPSYIHNFTDYHLGPTPRFKNFFEGNNGRIWIDPSSNDNILMGVHLTQLDGYNFQPVELNDSDIVGAVSFVTGMTERGEITGYNYRHFVFLFDLHSKSLQKYDLRPFIGEGVIRNVVPSKNGELLVLASGNDSLSLYRVHENEVKKMVQVAHKAKESIFTSWRSKRIPILENERGIWFMGNKLPLYNFQPKTGKLRTFNITEAGKNNLVIHEKLRTGSTTQLVETKEGLKLFFPAYAYKLFDFSYTSTKIEADNHYPPSWRPQYIAKDKKSNLLVVFKDRSDDYRAFLEGNNGQRFDYSNVVQQNVSERILQAKSSDFTQQVVINSASSLISVGVRNKSKTGLISFAANRHIVLPYSPPRTPFLSLGRAQDLYFIQGDKLVPIPTDTLKTRCDLQFIRNANLGNAVETTAGEIWMNHKIGSGGIFRLNYQDQTCEDFPMQDPPFGLVRLNDTTLILQKFQGLFYFDTRTGKEKPALDTPLLLDVTQYTYDLLLDAQKKLWIASNTGLLRVDLEERSQKIMGKEDGFQDMLYHDMYEGRNGEIYFGSTTKGLQIYDASTQLIKTIDYNKGLAHNNVRSIQEDEEGYIWVGTQNGLSLISPGGEVIRNFFTEDGLADNFFLLNASHQDKNGRLLLPTRTGLSLIDPQEIKKTLTQVKGAEEPLLTELHYFDAQLEEEVTLQILDNQPKHITLLAEQRYLNLKFALPNLVQPTATRFSYMLEGKDSDWISLGTKHELNLSRLPAGQYRLLIKGVDYLNRETGQYLAIHINAQEFFFKQTWFYIMGGILLSSIAGFWIFRLRFAKQRLEGEVKERTREIRQDKTFIEHQANQLQRANQLQNRFFINISHELRTPITLIGIPIEQILQKEKDSLSPQVRRSLGMVQDNTQKLNGLVEEILELTKLEAGNVQLQLTSVPLTPFIKQLFSAFHSQAVLKGIDYTIRSEVASDQHFLLDRGRLAKIINNLLSNALKFTPEKQSIQLHIKLNEKLANAENDLYSLSISVNDTGRGIPREDLPYVFDRYFQTNRSEMITDSGTGIGLALSKELAHLMNGELRVESEWGNGSTFTLRLNTVQSVEAPVEHTPAEISSPVLTTVPSPNKSNETLPQILIVEDNHDMQTLLLSLLEDHYYCHLANNGAQAWTMLQKPEIAGKVQLVISDVMMPEVDGYSLLAQIREVPDFQIIPIIMLTARTAEEDKLRALRLGVDDYLGKPFSANELLARSANLIQRYQLRLQYQTEEAMVAEEATPPSANQLWLQQIDEFILEAIDKKLEIGIPYLTHQMNLGDRQLLRRLKSLTGLTTNQYIQEIKLQCARRHLEQQVFLTVSEVAYASGFSTPPYFSKVYEKRFGKRPIEYFEALP